MYIVIGVEHTETFDNVPIFLGKYDTLEEAKKRKEELIAISLKDFPNEKEDDGFLYMTNESGDIDYSYVITIIEI